MSNSSKVIRKPSAWYYGLVLLVLLVGGILGIVFLVSNLLGVTDELTQIRVPGKSDLDLAETGSYTIFVEHESVMDGKVFSTSKDVSNFRCSLVNKQTGAEVPLSPSTMTADYNMPGRSGVSIFNFDLTETGSYEFTADYRDGMNEPQGVFAVAQGFGSKIIMLVWSVLAIFGVTVIVAILVGLAIFCMRRKVRNAPPGETA